MEYDGPCIQAKIEAADGEGLVATLSPKVSLTRMPRATLNALIEDLLTVSQRLVPDRGWRPSQEEGLPQRIE